MEAASPARLYAAVVGALLVVLGILGFFYSASFGDSGTVEEALGFLRVNAWLNVLYLLVGALGLLLAGASSRAFALAAGVLFTALAVWGWAIGSGDLVLGFLPADGGNEALHLTLGLLGFAAAAGTPRPNRPPRKRRPPAKKRDPEVAAEATEEPRSSKPRAKPVGKRA
ncbi:MAG TPA: DUF4383 domain-containing protein [Solirubrobacterales bacterium]|nr:DUF4383 domain-containing protein [Solirubrobacterales bacterium]